MAEILPFRGVLYDPAKVGDVTALVAPPYDVIGPAEQAALYDRYHLLETCRSNFSPIFSLYSDPAGDIIRTLEGADGGPPRIAVTDSDGGHHRLWTVTDPASIERVVATMKPLPLFIADGHHRYESALRYRNAQRKVHGESR